MRCLAKSRKYGSCVLDTHIQGKHINGQGLAWRGSSTVRKGKEYFCYLNHADGMALQQRAEVVGLSPGQLVREYVLSGLGNAVSESEVRRRLVSRRDKALVKLSDSTRGRDQSPLYYAYWRGYVDAVETDIDSCSYAQDDEHVHWTAEGSHGYREGCEGCHVNYKKAAEEGQVPSRGHREGIA